MPKPSEMGDAFHGLRWAFIAGIGSDGRDWSTTHARRTQASERKSIVAAILGMKPTTLASRIKVLGLRKN